MNDANDVALEVSMLVWFDDEVESWVYSVVSVHDGFDETLIAWGECDSRADAAEQAVLELQTYFSGV